MPEGESGFPASLWAVSWFRGCPVPSPALGGRLLGRQNQTVALLHWEEVGNPPAQRWFGLNPREITPLLPGKRRGLMVARLFGAGWHRGGGVINHSIISQIPLL